MTKVEFESTLIKYGFEEDSEYKGCFNHPDESAISAWYNDDGTMTICWDHEYHIKRPITDTRLIALLELYQK